MELERDVEIQDTNSTIQKEIDTSPKKDSTKKKNNGKEEILNPSPTIERRYTIALNEVPSSVTKQNLKEAKKREKEEEKLKKIEEKRKKEEEKKKKEEDKKKEKEEKKKELEEKKKEKQEKKKKKDKRKSASAINNKRSTLDSTIITRSPLLVTENEDDSKFIRIKKEDLAIKKPLVVLPKPRDEVLSSSPLEHSAEYAVSEDESSKKEKKL